MQVLLLIGTKKGAFMVESDLARRAWHFRRPLISGTWSIYHLSYQRALEGTGRVGTIWGGGSSNWYGPAVWKSIDLGESWTHSSEGLTYGDDGPGVEQIWQVTAAHGAVYAGVDPAGLFRSDDDGTTWTHVAGLRGHPSRATWRATNAGLPLHTMVPHPQDSERMWVGISAGGTYRTTDGGRTWARCAALAGGQAGEVGPCVHALARGASGALYQQNHDGVYCSDDNGTTWMDISAGLPSRFGFPIAASPHAAGGVYVVPLESDQPGRRHVPNGRLAIWRTRDAGVTWTPLTAGLPAGRTYASVLRGALAVDTLQPAGVYFGTPTGQLYGSADAGDHWFELAGRLPPIYSVTCAVVP